MRPCPGGHGSCRDSSCVADDLAMRGGYSRRVTMETEEVMRRGGEGRRGVTTEGLPSLPSLPMWADVPRPVCLGLAVRETFESLLFQVPCFAWWVRAGWGRRISPGWASRSYLAVVGEDRGIFSTAE